MKELLRKDLFPLMSMAAIAIATITLRYIIFLPTVL